MARPYRVSSGTFATLTCAGIVAGAMGGQIAHIGGAIIGVAPFFGAIATLALRKGDFRPPTQEEAALLIEAENLTGLRDLHSHVRLPRSNRSWTDAIITGVGFCIAGIVIGIAAL